MTDQTFLRACANALWPSLRRNRWQTHTVTRDLSKYNPRGYVSGPRSATVAQAPSASAVVEIHHESFITAVLYAEDWPGGTSHALRLDQTDYADVVGDITAEEAVALAKAVCRASCRAPFHAQANRHGIMRLRRNATDEHITPAVAQVLERIAAATVVRPIAEADLDDALFRDEEIDHEAVLASLGYERANDQQRKRNVANNTALCLDDGVTASDLRWAAARASDESLYRHVNNPNGDDEAHYARMAQRFRLAAAEVKEAKE